MHMGDYIWTRVTAGGKITRASIARLIPHMEDQTGDMGEPEQEITDALKEKRPALICMAETGGGLAEEVTDLLTELGLHWKRVTDGKYEYDGDITIYHPVNGERTWQANTNGDDAMMTLESLRVAARAGKTIEAVIADLALSEQEPPALELADAGTPTKRRGKKGKSNA
jgi:hypothetical protein